MSQAGIIKSSGGGAITSVTADTGTATPVAGVLQIDSATAVGGTADNITTAASGNTVTVSLKNSISQPNTNAAGTTGLYSLGGNRFLHNYGTLNTFVGGNTGNLSLTGTLNTGVGYGALNAVSSGSSNCCVGEIAGLALTTGSENIVVGRAALSNSLDSASNTFVGHAVATDLGHGTENIGIGKFSMHGSGGSNPTYNVGIGSNTEYSITSGAYNNTIGYNGLNLLSTGSYNNSLGDLSLEHITTGSYNLGFGHDAGINYTGAESSNIVVQNDGVLGESNTIRIGTQGAGNGQQNACYLAGVTGVTTANTQLVTINSSTGQLGAKAIQGVMTWTAVGVSGALANNNGYLCTTGAALSFSLPATAAVGTQIGIVLAGSTSWTITQGAGQSITISPTTSTPGVGGSVASLTAGTTLTLICDVADTHWTAIASTGTFTIV